MEVKCKICSHTWNYKGNSKVYATCPSCLNKTRVEEVELKKDG